MLEAPELGSRPPLQAEVRKVLGCGPSPTYAESNALGAFPGKVFSLSLKGLLCLCEYEVSFYFIYFSPFSHHL